MKSKIFLIAVSLLITSCTTYRDMPSPNAPTIDIYKSTPLSSWNLFIENYETQQVVSGDKTSLPKGDVAIQLSDKDSKKDALNFSWKDSWRAGLTWEKEHLWI